LSSSQIELKSATQEETDPFAPLSEEKTMDSQEERLRESVFRGIWTDPINDLSESYIEGVLKKKKKKKKIRISLFNCVMDGAGGDCCDESMMALHSPMKPSIRRSFSPAFEINSLRKFSSTTNACTVVTPAKSPSTGRSFVYFPKLHPRSSPLQNKKNNKTSKSQSKRFLTVQLCLLQRFVVAICKSSPNVRSYTEKTTTTESAHQSRITNQQSQTLQSFG
jgi:hypothetical protein